MKKYKKNISNKIIESQKKYKKSLKKDNEEIFVCPELFNYLSNLKNTK